jgi:dephospho-CoA kinase
MTYKIAIAGKMGSGKTTLAQMLSEQHTSPSVRLYSFATKVKDTALELGLISKKDLKEKNSTTREILQELGQGIRNIGKDVWINYLLEIMETDEAQVKINKGNLLQIVDDVRYINEFEALVEGGFYMVRLVTADCYRFERINSKNYYLTEHASETSLDSNSLLWDTVISNNKTKEELYEKSRLIYKIATSDGL